MGMIVHYIVQVMRLMKFFFIGVDMVCEHGFDSDMDGAESYTDDASADDATSESYGGSCISDDCGFKVASESTASDDDKGGKHDTADEKHKAIAPNVENRNFARDFSDCGKLHEYKLL